MIINRFIRIFILAVVSSLLLQIFVGCKNKDALVTDIPVTSDVNRSVESLFTDDDPSSYDTDGIIIDDAAAVIASPGESELQYDSSGESSDPSEYKTPESNGIEYAVNTNTNKFHLPECGSVAQIKEKNLSHEKDRDKLIGDGYAPCKRCNP